ncbi:acyl-CoA dehydrogenase family protein [Paenibacillus sp. JTLBN-2024]
MNGTKQFITNAGFADIFIVYAKVDGKDFSTFIVERTMEGVSIGPEEKDGDQRLFDLASSFWRM